MTLADEHLARAKICDVGRELLARGLVARTWGNISARVSGTHFLVTPSGRPYEDMAPGDIVRVDTRHGKADPGLRPSAEVHLHAAVYRERPEIGAVIHTHQQNASTLAAARRELPPVLDDVAQILGPNVRVAEYALPSTHKTVVATMRALRGRRAALIANHGAICLGSDLEEALSGCMVLEKACKAFIEAEFLGGAKSISKFEAHLLHQYYLRRYSKRAQDNRVSRVASRLRRMFA